VCEADDRVDELGEEQFLGEREREREREVWCG